MKVKGDLQPKAFTLEQQPNKPGFFLARFYENVRPFERVENGVTVSGYEYDEYYLELADTGNLQSDIESGYNLYVSMAKKAEGVPDTAEAWYKALVQEYIHNVYSLDDETALINGDLANARAGRESTAEFISYRDFVDECKKRARETVSNP